MVPASGCFFRLTGAHEHGCVMALGQMWTLRRPAAHPKFAHATVAGLQETIGTPALVGHHAKVVQLPLPPPRPFTTVHAVSVVVLHATRGARLLGPALRCDGHHHVGEHAQVHDARLLQRDAEGRRWVALPRAAPSLLLWFFPRRDAVLGIGNPAPVPSSWGPGKKRVAATQILERAISADKMDSVYIGYSFFYVRN